MNTTTPTDWLYAVGARVRITRLRDVPNGHNEDFFRGLLEGKAGTVTSATAITLTIDNDLRKAVGGRPIVLDTYRVVLDDFPHHDLVFGPDELEAITIDGSARGSAIDTDALQVAISWLDSRQPTDAAVSQHGIHGAIDAYMVQVTPVGGRRPDSGPVVVFTLRDKCQDRRPQQIVNGIDAEDAAGLRAAVERIVPVVDQWNGMGPMCDTVSFRIAADVSIGVRRALENYVPFKAPKVKVTTPPGWVA